MFLHELLEEKIVVGEKIFCTNSIELGRSFIIVCGIYCNFFVADTGAFLKKLKFFLFISLHLRCFFCLLQCRILLLIIIWRLLYFASSGSNIIILLFFICFLLRFTQNSCFLCMCIVWRKLLLFIRNRFVN